MAWCKSTPKIYLLFLLYGLSALCAPTTELRAHADEQNPGRKIQIGVLAKRGHERCMEEWDATAEHLTASIPELEFEIVPLAFDKVFEEAAKENIDFYIINSAMYVQLAHRFGAKRISTMRNKSINGQGHSEFGSVVIFRSEDIAEPQWKDLKDVRIGAVDEFSFGGWLAAKYEAQMLGHAFRQKNIQFYGSHDAVVEAVLDQTVSAGVVRTDTLERMSQEGKVSLGDFSFIRHCEKSDPHNLSFTFRHSTQLYPEWPIAAAENTPTNIAEKVQVALVQLPQNSQAAIQSNILGWTIPAGYKLVEDCLKAVNAPPFEDYGKVSYMEASRQHWKPFLVFVLLFLALLILSIALQRKVGELRKTRRHLKVALRKQTKLKETAETYLNISSEIIISLNPSGTIELLNKGGHLLLGYENQTLIGKNWFEKCLPKENEAETHKIFQQILHGEIELTRQHENPVLRKDGERRQILWFNTALTDDSGNVIGILCSGTDVTETRQHQDALEQRNEELKIAKEAAEDSSKAKSEFLSVMSHELRTPLNPIIGFSEILLDITEDEEARKYIEIILSSGTHLEALISDLLDYSRIGTGKYVITYESIDPKTIFDESMNSAKKIAQERGISIKSHLDKGVPSTISTDTKRLRQIVDNLLTNAIKYSNEGEVELSGEFTDGAFIIHVKDQGIGISEKDIKCIFEPFYQVDSSNVRKVGGTGIGLGLVQKIAQSMGGEVSAESQLGEGSCFTVKLPATNNTVGQDFSI